MLSGIEGASCETVEPMHLAAILDQARGLYKERTEKFVAGYQQNQYELDMSALVDLHIILDEKSNELFGD
jgi:hypothetical protein